ncbi:serine hydrolase domain-containing protein [Streptomyces resistomycificus]|uniref:Beta-lactamase n=1 Tax=Streptomyces resistomycificus TaxID=67356 RepID=A0A0L8LAZ6_9ACTN|nr:serine hydrolase domain-containing protein [Streptomyces resistomycificus]KOG35196.1 beta-lactamase [Streptomyces resistomycificus]KUN99942.1 serine hydrolase [Streptomyces resistomycificus]
MSPRRPPRRALPTSTPAAQGVNASGIEAFLDALEAAPGIEPHSLMILRHDHVVAAGWWAPYTPDRVHLLYSLSKSFTAAAAGFAVAEGLIGLDDPVISYFPEFASDITDPRSRAMLVRHVASMSSGHDEETHERALALDRDEPVRGFLLLPPDGDPGTVFAYNQPTTYTLAAILQRVTGQSLTEYLRPRLLDPLGIEEVAWTRDRAGRELGFSGLHATTEAIARFGLLHLRDGVWEGERLLPEGWVAEASRVHIETADATMADWRNGYGLQFWRSRHGYRGDGAYGQYCLVLPEQDAVVAMTSESEDMQEVLDLVWEHLTPAFEPGPSAGRQARDAALAERLARLSLPSAPGKPAPPDRTEAWAGAEFGADAAEDGALRPGSTVEVSSDGDGWCLTLVEEGDRLELPLGPGGWAVAEEPVPVAVSAGWTDADTLVADLLFLETPHHLVVTCSLTDRTCTARWRTQPLHARRLRSLKAPRGSS